MSKFNFRNLKPRYVEQDQFDWVQDNNLPEERELVSIYFHKAINLTQNGLQVFQEATQQLLDIRISNQPIVIKGKPLMATGGIALKPTYENMIANIAFSEQPEFLIFDPLISEAITGQSIKPQQVDIGNGEKARPDQAVGSDLFFVRLEQKNEPNKARWFIIQSIQTQVNTDNTFSVAKIRLTPFNFSLLPKNLKLKFDPTNNVELASKPTKYIRITTKPQGRLGQFRVVGTNKDPRLTLEEFKDQPWKYENDPEGAIMVKEYPKQVSGQSVIWYSDWIEQNQNMWGTTKNGIHWPIPNYQENVFGLSSTGGGSILNIHPSFDTHNTENYGFARYPILSVDSLSYNFPFLNQEGDNNNLENKAINFANYNKTSSVYALANFGKHFNDADATIFAGTNDFYGSKIVNSNPYFNQRSAFRFVANYSQEKPTTLSNTSASILTFGFNLIGTALADHAWYSAWRTQHQPETPDYKTRLESLMQTRGVPYYYPAPIKEAEDIDESYRNLLRSSSPRQFFYSDFPQEKLEKVSGSTVEKLDVASNQDDAKYIWMTKSLMYDTMKTQNNNDYYPYIKFGNIGYATSKEDGTNEEFLTLKRAFFSDKDFGEGDGDFDRGSRDWLKEDLYGIAHFDYITSQSYSAQFNNNQLRNWYEKTDQFKKEASTDLVQEIVLTKTTYIDRVSFILGAGNSGEDYKIEYFDENRKLILKIEEQWPQNEDISKYTISTK